MNDYDNGYDAGMNRQKFHGDILCEQSAEWRRGYETGWQESFYRMD